MSSPRVSSTSGRIGGLILALALSNVPRSLQAEPPTVLDVPDDGGRPIVPGETPPPPDRRLPVQRLPKAPTPAVVEVPQPPPPPPPPPTAPPPTAPLPIVVAPPEPDKPLAPWVPKHAFQLEVGPMWLPQPLFGLFSRFDKHPQLRGTAIDLSWWSPVLRDRWIAVRLGLGLPSVPASNWYESGKPRSDDPAQTDWRPLYTRLGLVTLDVAVDYLARVKLYDRLDWTWRAGVGLVILAGNVDLTETLPNCSEAERQTCPHWRNVGKSEANLPRVLPMLRATTGLSWRLSERASVGVEGGLRDVLWFGASAVMQY